MTGREREGGWRAADSHLKLREIRLYYTITDQPQGNIPEVITEVINQ